VTFLHQSKSEATTQTFRKYLPSVLVFYLQLNDSERRNNVPLNVEDSNGGAITVSSHYQHKDRLSHISFQTD